MRLPILRCLPSPAPTLALSLLLLGGCGLHVSNPTGTDSIHTFTVLYTNDEHGWMEGQSAGQGAANLYRLWQEQEGYTPDGNFLLLSGGDHWTGPAISTTVEGESMVQVMNAMHYDATAVGNHEFDFGLDVLAQRVGEADFPYLSANTHWRTSGAVPTELGIQPFTVLELDSLRIGIIGLTTTSTPRTTNPANVAQLVFEDYEATLRATVPLVRAEAVDLLFVIAHVCLAPIRQLAETLVDLDIQFMGTGHCNDLVAERINDTIVLGGGSHLASYAKAQFQFDRERGRVIDVDYAVQQNLGASESPEIASVVSTWQQQVDARMAVVIGYSAQEIPRRDARLEQQFIDSWLQTDPTAELAISNAGGIRSALPAGSLTVGTVVGMLPFDNTIIAVYLTGSELEQVLAAGTSPLVAGLQHDGNDWILVKSGLPLEQSSTYRVLVNSFMYAGGDNYEGIAAADPEGFDTGINYRQPFLDWLQAQGSTADRPLQLP